MGTRRIKVKRWKVDGQGKITGRHYDHIVEDDLVTDWCAVIDEDHPLLGGPSATNAGAIPPGSVANANLTYDAVVKMLNMFQFVFTGWRELRQRLTKEEMAKQVELYKNVIETKFGVKLCVKSNFNSDMITMELLVPTKLFADDGGRESLADALQNIAMFILNMENPSDL